MSLSAWELPFKNNSGETIPPFAVMRGTGLSAISGTNRYVVTVAKPNTYGSQYTHYLNGPVEVADGAYGTCTNTFPAIAKHGSGTPSAGTLWGPRNNGWTLEQKTGGFIVLGIQETGYVIVNRCPMLAFTGKFDSDTTQGNTGTVSVYWQGVDTGENISTVYAISNDFVTTDNINVSWINERWEAYCRD